MKKYPVSFLLFSLLFTGYSYGFDLKGLQPLAPNGIFSTFSAESLKRGTSGIGFEIEKSHKPDFYRLTSRLAYGISDKVELEVTIPYVAKWKDSANGFEDIAIGLKHRFFDEGKYGPSIAYLLTLSMPSGKDEFSTDGSIGGGIIVSKRVGPVNGHVNLFYSRPGTNRFKDDITFAAGVDFSAARNFKILGELYSKKSYSGSLDRLEARFGYRIMTTENLLTTLGVGFNIKNRSPEYRIMVSLTYLFLSDEGKAKKGREQED